MVGKITPDNMVTASRIAQCMGLSPYATQNELLKEMVHLDEGGQKKEWEGNELTYFGNLWEPHIIAEVAKRLDLTDVEDEVTTPHFTVSCKLAASLDGIAVGTRTIKTDHSNGIFVVGGEPIDLAGQRVAIEIKTTQAAPEDTPPPHRGVLQLQAQMLCASIDFGILAVLYRGSELRVWVYRSDLKVQKDIVDAVNDFEKRRANIDWYPVLTSEDGNVAFSNVDDAAPTLDVSDADVQEAIEILVQAKRLKKEVAEQINLAETVIKEYMGNHEEARTIVDGIDVIVKWPMRKTRAQPEKVVPAKPETKTRQNTLTIKELGQA